VVAGTKRKRGLKESLGEDGKLVINLIANDDDEVQAPPLAVAGPVEEDDDVLFVSMHPVRKAKTVRETAAKPQVKTED
jgi:hypothetical protein